MRPTPTAVAPIMIPRKALTAPMQALLLGQLKLKASSLLAGCVRGLLRIPGTGRLVSASCACKVTPDVSFHGHIELRYTATQAGSPAQVSQRVKCSWFWCLVHSSDVHLLVDRSEAEFMRSV